MKKYNIIVKRPAVKFLNKLPKSERQRILSAINKLPYSGDILPLKGYEGILRLRVGSYRIIFSADNNELIIYVIDIGNRGQIYKKY